MTLNQTKTHLHAVRAQARNILELHEKYKVNIKDLAGRFDCSPTLIKDILKDAKKKRLPQGPL